MRAVSAGASRPLLAPRGGPRHVPREAGARAAAAQLPRWQDPGGGCRAGGRPQFYAQPRSDRPSAPSEPQLPAAGDHRGTSVVVPEPADLTAQQCVVELSFCMLVMLSSLI